MTTDAQLWDRAKNGERCAFGTLFDRHVRAVYNHCFRRTANWSEAEDLTSLVFLEAWRRRDAVRLQTSSVLPWLLGVANNVLRNRARARRRHQAALARMPAHSIEQDHSAEIAGRMDDEATMKRVLTLVNNLPANERDVLSLCAWSELSYEQAAAALGIPVGTVRSRLSRARAKLRRWEARAEWIAEPESDTGHDKNERQGARRTTKENTR